MTELTAAVAFKQEGLVKKLVNQGAEVNYRNWTGETPLCLAAISGNEKIINFLIDHGADIDMPDKYGNTPLMNAIKEEAPIKIINLFINKGADIKIQNKWGSNSLHYAALRSSYKVMWRLIEAGLSMNLGDNKGRTPFELALSHSDSIRSKNEKALFIDKLIDNGAKITELSNYKDFLDIGFRNNKNNAHIHLSLLSRGAIFKDHYTIECLAKNISNYLETHTLAHEKKYTGIKALKKAIDGSDILEPQIKENAIKHIDNALKELKNPAFHSLITKIRAGFDNEKVEDRYRQIARDMSPDYPEVNLLKDYGEGRITSRKFTDKYDSQFLGSVLETIRTTSPNPILQNPEMATKISPYCDSETLKALRTALKPQTVKKYNPEEIKKIFDNLSISIDDSPNPNKFADKVSQQNKTHSKGEGGRGMGS